ncbi:MAG: FtsX-like permease family protein [Dysgonomonas sp.]|nr:FtsX-like permease family protein [Dysgonomonas sp.]
MYNIPLVLRRFFKSKSLRIINLIGLSLMFACLLVSYSYIKKETSFDKFYSNSDRIVRMSIAYDGNLADGRVYGGAIKEIWQGIPEIEGELKLNKVDVAVLNLNGKKETLNDLYFASHNLFDILDIPLIEGDSRTAFRSPSSIIISRRIALRLFGRTNVIGEKLDLSSRRFLPSTPIITGVFEDMPENTHFHPNFIASSDNFDDKFYYVYFLMEKGYIKADVEKKIKDRLLTNNEDLQVDVDLMPITDIHLHSHVLREMEPNGNILYIYLLIGINALLFVIVMFNLWLNSNVIFSYNKRYYQLLRLNGASSSIVLKDEFYVSLILAILSILAGKLISILFCSFFAVPLYELYIYEEVILLLLFTISIILVSLLPVLSNISSTLFFNNNSIDLRKSRFSVSNIKYMLIVQYSIVLFIIIVGLGINNQVSFIRSTQIGGNDNNIVVIDEQPHEVNQNYVPFRNELLKHSEIELVTAAMQLPGPAVRDMIGFKQDGKEAIYVPILVVGEDFFSMFGIKPIAGTSFPPLKLSYAEEEHAFKQNLNNGIKTTIKDNIIINKKALAVLGFSSPEDAIGKEIEIEHTHLSYFPEATICGVVDNFTYTNLYEESIPMIILQRNIFMNCFMIKFAPGQDSEGLKILNDTWQKFNPDYPINYTYLTDSYAVLYKNELDAEKVVNFFSILSFIITILGLVTFMSFMIRNRTKEIAIRKVNGATDAEIVSMLNWGLLRWTLFSFVVAMPLAWYILDKWLENFAHRSALHWSVYIGGGLVVLLISFLVISWQSIRASHMNPAQPLRGE